LTRESFCTLASATELEIISPFEEETVSPACARHAKASNKAMIFELVIFIMKGINERVD
jgi:hypothetical protein